MKIELDVFNKRELIRASELIGYKNKNGSLSKSSENQLKDMIVEKVNPHNINLREQYYSTLDLFKVKYSNKNSDEVLRSKLYAFTCKKLEERIKKMSKRKKKKLAEQLEASLDPTALDELKKVGRRGAMVGSGILILQGGAIVITGSNLGICILLTTSLSTISSILGITFPFAVYTSAAVLGGEIIAIGHFLANPFVAIPLIGISLYLIYRKVHNRQFVNLASVNYLIESKKALEI